MAESRSSSAGDGPQAETPGNPAPVPGTSPGAPAANTSVPTEASSSGEPVAEVRARPEVAVDYMPPLTWKSIAAMVVILALGLGSCAGLGYWGTYELMDSEATRWVDRYKTHREVVRRLGVIEQSGFDAQSALKESNEETLTFFLQGPKGRGQLRVTEFGMQVPRVELVIKDEVIVIQRGVATRGGAHGESHAPEAGGDGHGTDDQKPANPASQPEGDSSRE